MDARMFCFQEPETGLNPIHLARSSFRTQDSALFAMIRASVMRRTKSEIPHPNFAATGGFRGRPFGGGEADVHLLRPLVRPSRRDCVLVVIGSQMSPKKSAAAAS